MDSYSFLTDDIFMPAEQEAKAPMSFQDELPSWDRHGSSLDYPTAILQPPLAPEFPYGDYMTGSYAPYHGVSDYGMDSYSMLTMDDFNSSPTSS